MKNRRFCRVVLLVLCAAMLLSLVACAPSGEDAEKAPDGMQFATASGADYRLFIPTHWSANLAYGVSGGYYSLGTQSTVSMKSYPITEEMEKALSTSVSAGESTAASETDKSDAKSPWRLRADWFYEKELKPLIASLATGGVSMEEINCVSVLLDGVNAQQYHARATLGDSELHFVQAVAERGGKFYVLSFTCENSLYPNLKEDYSSILLSFRFSEKPYVPTEPLKEIPDGEAPEGMKLASNGDVAYAFYVPASWQIDANEEIFAATAPDGSSMSVIPYMPGSDEIMSVPEYYEWNKAAMLKTAPNGFAEKSAEEIRVDGVAAMRYEYSYAVGGVTYHYVQVIAVWRGMFYNLTYTALPENFDANLADVQSILDAFDFL